MPDKAVSGVADCDEGVIALAEVTEDSRGDVVVVDVPAVRGGVVVGIVRR